jgi:alpha-amylase/alpha-mannosidase (GH57 family)
MSRYACIHGHFYQPPRENPWFERIEVQDSAYPFHDWNERITAECYAPNSAARILDEDGLITRIVNNYSMMSFNAGPTLLSWLEDNHPNTYLALIEADHIGSNRFRGHGPAIAQCYNHMIMPLANRRDKQTQVRWGVEDFLDRFGREPEGMWLPEMAVDLETLRIMAAEGIRYVILEPHQVARVRDQNGTWRSLPDGWIDPKVPYRVDPGEGQEIAIFINDVGIAHEVAFGNLLRDGHWLLSRLAGAFDGREEDQLVHFAIDGETYGHHFHFGEMALAYCLSRLGEEGITPTIYGEYLSTHPPQQEIEIREDTAWSCPHSLARWKGGCTCSTGTHPGWSLEWRMHLRRAFDLLRDRASIHYEEAASPLLQDPWAARNEYISIINDRSHTKRAAFLEKHATRSLDREELVLVLELLEMQRNLMLMYTSCGWFFDDIAGIEAVQVMWYAARALQLYRSTGGADPTADLLSILAQAKANTIGYSDGASVWQSRVLPHITDLRKVCGHFALTSLFCSYPDTSTHAIYQVTRFRDCQEQEERRRIAVGAARVRSLLTCESKEFIYAAAYPGGPNLLAGVAPYAGGKAFGEIRDAVCAAWRDPTSSFYDELTRWFGEGCIRGTDLLRDEARTIVSLILKTSISRIEDSFQDIYTRYLPLMESMHMLEMPIPAAIAVPVAHILHRDLVLAVGSTRPDPVEMSRIVDAMQRFAIPPEKEKLSMMTGSCLSLLLQDLLGSPGDPSILASIFGIIQVISGLSLTPSLWEAQNAFIQLRDAYMPVRNGKAGDRRYHSLPEQIEDIGRFLGVRI